MLLHSKATSRFLSCPHVLLHHLPLLCWCSCLWDNAENQQWYPAKWGLLLVALKANKKKKTKKITTWATSLVGFQHYSSDSCTDVDYVQLMSNQRSSFPSSATGEKSWHTTPEETTGWSHCSPRRKHLCHDWQLLYKQSSNLQRWICHDVPQQSKDSFLVLIILHTDNLFLKTLVPKVLYLTDELWLRQHLNSSISIHRTFALPGKALLLGGQLLKRLWKRIKKC